MKKILDIQKIAEGQFQCSINSTESELSDAIAGLCLEEEGELFFDAIVDALVSILSNWDDKDIDSFSNELNKVVKNLKAELKDIESKRLTYN